MTTLNRRGETEPPPDSHAPRADLLMGYAAIGEHLRLNARQAEHRATMGEIPTFRIGRTVCARPSSLDAHFRQLEEAARGERR